MSRRTIGVVSRSLTLARGGTVGCRATGVGHHRADLRNQTRHRRHHEAGGTLADPWAWMDSAPVVFPSPWPPLLDGHRRRRRRVSTRTVGGRCWPASSPTTHPTRGPAGRRPPSRPPAPGRCWTARPGTVARGAPASWWGHALPDDVHDVARRRPSIGDVCAHLVCAHGGPRCHFPLPGRSGLATKYQHTAAHMMITAASAHIVDLHPLLVQHG